MTITTIGLDNENTVPCGTCTACCRNFPAIFLHPEHGDKPEDYDTVMELHPIKMEMTHMLKHKESGDCAYLEGGQCSIYEKRPIICRDYDCRVNYMAWTKKRRLRLGTPEIWEAAKKRLHTLPGVKRLAAIAQRKALHG